MGHLRVHKRGARGVQDLGEALQVGNLAPGLSGISNRSPDFMPPQGAEAAEDQQFGAAGKVDRWPDRP